MRAAMLSTSTGLRCGESRAGSYQSRRPQLSQVNISLLLRSRRSFQRCGRCIIWQAMHFWFSTSATPVPLAFAMRS